MISPGLFLAIRIFFKLEALAPLFFSIAVIFGLFFEVDLTMELDLEVFLTDSFVCLAAFINLEKEENDRFYR